jgi:PrtD family type I secretion system ABC transporter
MTFKSSAPPDDGTVVSEMEMRTLSGLLRQCKRAFVFVFILTFVIEIMSIAPILYMLNVYDRVLSSRSIVTLVSLTVLMIGTYIFWSGLEWIRRRMLVRISLRLDWDLAAEAFDASFRRFVGRKKVNIHQVLGDLVLLRQFLTGSPLLALMSAPFAIFFIVFAAFFHPLLALFALLASAALLLITYLTQRVSAPVLKDANNALAEANRLAAQSLRNAETALALGMHRTIRKRWYTRHQGYLRMQVNASEAASLLGGASGFFTKAFPSLQLAVGVFLAIEGFLTGGMVMAANFLMAKSIGPIRQVLTSWKEVADARQAYERLDMLLTEGGAATQRMELPPPNGYLNVSDLVVHPEGASRAVLNGISFSLEPGQVTVVVGPSAAGKSSLVKALVGIWIPTKGSVRLDGADVSGWVRENLGQYIGYVPQENEFFEGTVAENIARLGPVDAEKVVRAARLVDIHELILSFPQGYDTPLGDNGYVLTGGQKQRIAIARAIYNDPCYVVMDEPNASLDELGERALVRTIRTLKGAGATVIFTTHRPDLVNIADNLLVLNAGKQVGFGTVVDMLDSARKLRDAAKQKPVAAHAAQSPKTGPDNGMKGAAA